MRWKIVLLHDFTGALSFHHLFWFLSHGRGCAYYDEASLRFLAFVLLFFRSNTPVIIQSSSSIYIHYTTHDISVHWLDGTMMSPQDSEVLYGRTLISTAREPRLLQNIGISFGNSHPPSSITNEILDELF